MAAFEAALAAPERVMAFRVQLDTYDAKTVEALMENQEAFDAVRRRIEDIMERAHVLPDGRRVFKTEDGLRVFDEHGTAVPLEIIDPNQIDNRKPSWEALQREQEAAARLAAERQQLLDYQRKLDEARERLDRGEITNGELRQMQEGLSAGMPNAVRQRLDAEGRDPAQAQRRDIAAAPATPAALPDNMDDLMRQTGLGQGAAAPRL